MQLKNLANKPRTNVSSSTLRFPSLDTDGMIKKMDLRKAAKKQALSNEPPSSLEAFDFVEQRIINEIETEAHTQNDNYLAYQNSYSARAADTGVRNNISEIKSISDNAAVDFGKYTRIGTGRLHTSAREVAETEQYLKEYKKTHKLDRPVRNQGPKTYKIGVLIILLVIETIMNGMFFAQALTSGFLGGAALAMMISVFNIFLSFGIGLFLFRWFYYKDNYAKGLAGIGALCYLGGAVFVHLGVAHYRNVTGLGGFEEASIAAWTSLTDNPLNIADIESWMLFVVGYSFSLLAAYDGSIWTDPYPSFGRISRDNADAIEDYIDHKEELLDEIEDVKKSAEKKISELAKGVEGRQREVERIAALSESAHLAIKNHFDLLETACNTLLSFYRGEFSKHADDNQVQRFRNRESWKYQRPNTGDAVIKIGAYQWGQSQNVAANASITKAMNNLNTAYADAMARYEGIDELASKERTS